MSNLIQLSNLSKIFISQKKRLNVLRKINNKPKSTQRELAKELGFSLGKLNYCLNTKQNK